MTYGATGTEYTAQNCSIALDHFAITCYTVRGTGRFLRWIVSVGGQRSAASANYTSYSAPRITSLVPNAILTNGGVAVVLTGYDFASRYGAAVVRVYLNNFDVASPSQTNIDSYIAQLTLGADSLGAVVPATALTTVQAWIAVLTEIVPFTLPLPEKSTGTLSFTLPSGFGPSQEVLVLVDGVPSNVIRYS